jgi:pimeloyl-ACP methyl ester carboxylesterase
MFDYLLASVLAALLVSFASAARIVWVRWQLRRMRHTLVVIHGFPEDEEMHAELRKAAVRLSPRLGRFVRVDNLGTSRV